MVTNNEDHWLVDAQAITKILGVHRLSQHLVLLNFTFADSRRRFSRGYAVAFKQFLGKGTTVTPLLSRGFAQTPRAKEIAEASRQYLRQAFLQALGDKPGMSIPKLSKLLNISPDTAAVYAKHFTQVEGTYGRRKLYDFQNLPELVEWSI